MTWDGKASGGVIVPDGVYDVRLTPRDAVGNPGTPVTRSVSVVALLGFLTTSKTVFYPQDRDTMSTGTRLTFRLQRPATVTWTVRNAAGTVVATLLDAVDAPGGTDRSDLLRPGHRWLDAADRQVHGRRQRDRWRRERDARPWRSR